MDKELEKGQQQNGNYNPRPSLLTEYMATCTKCNKIFRKNYVNISENINVLCPKCSVNRSNSPDNSISDQRSVQSQHLQARSLQLQRLEEKQALNLKQIQLQREYLNKKLLEEADNLCEGLSNKSQSIQNWINETSLENPEVEQPAQNLPTTNNNADGSIWQQAHDVPNETTQ